MVFLYHPRIIDAQVHADILGYSQRIPNSISILSRLSENPYETNYQTVKDALKDDSLIPAIYVNLFDLENDIRHISDAMCYWFSKTNRILTFGEIEGALPYYNKDVYDRFLDILQRFGTIYGIPVFVDFHCGHIDEEDIRHVFPNYQNRIGRQTAAEAHDPRELDLLFRKYPEITFVLSHPFNGTTDYCVRLALYLDNVYLGTAAKEDERKELLGSMKEHVQLYRKVVFQSDGNPESLDWWSSRIRDEKLLNLILYENATRILGLPTITDKNL